MFDILRVECLLLHLVVVFRPNQACSGAEGNMTGSDGLQTVATDRAHPAREMETGRTYIPTVNAPSQVLEAARNARRAASA